MSGERWWTGRRAAAWVAAALTGACSAGSMAAEGDAGVYEPDAGMAAFDGSTPNTDAGPQPDVVATGLGYLCAVDASLPVGLACAPDSPAFLTCEDGGRREGWSYSCAELEGGAGVVTRPAVPGYCVHAGDHDDFGLHFDLVVCDVPACARYQPLDPVCEAGVAQGTSSFFAFACPAETWEAGVAAPQNGCKAPEADNPQWSSGSGTGAVMCCPSR